MLVGALWIPGSLLGSTASFQAPVSGGQVMNQYCSPCHGKALAPANVALPLNPTVAQIRANPTLYGRALRAVQSGHMPPKGAKQPTPAERSALVRFLESSLSAEAPRVTMRRLNRAEYNNTIRDLTGLDLKLADDFPADDVGYGFDQNGDVLTLSPLLMEKYIDAAITISSRLVPDTSEKEFVHAGVEFDSKTSSSPLGSDSRMFYKNGVGELMVQTLVGGDYRLELTADGDQAGDEPCRMSCWLNGEKIKTFDISATRDQRMVVSVVVRMGKGPNVLGVSFDNDFFSPGAKADRNLVLHQVKIVGPLRGTASAGGAFAQRPDAGNVRAITRRTIEQFAAKAWRRPVTADQLDALEAQARKFTEWEDGMRAAIASVLSSPRFLFRIEQGTGASRPLDAYELASRLSYFLWASMPDDTLYARAADGSLLQPEELDRQVARMILDPKSRSLSTEFAGQWLQLRKLQSHVPDKSVAGPAPQSLVKSMIEETTRFFDYIVRNDRPVTEILDGQVTFVNGELGQLYGMPDVTGTSFRRVSVSSADRRGILGQASILTLTSNPTRTSPVKRGKFVLENLLGTPPPPPPPGVGVLNDAPAVVAATSIRDRLAAHRSNPACANCHKQMDAIGFSLENFDPVGRWRTVDGKFAIDASGKLDDGTEFLGPQGLRKLLMDRVDLFATNFTERLATYALGRGPTPADLAEHRRIAAAAAKSQYRFSSFVQELVKSPLFLKTGGGNP
ncbi:MAG: DUF1592 domain-containing protein [Chthonomonas sp.]|nr:DUF1592 domain-containing protein [Chthonomonas sp.]